MYRLASHKVLLALVLLAFLFSPNVLCFGNHAAEEMLQAVDQIASASVVSLEDQQAVYAHHQVHPDAGHGESHQSSNSCDTHHTHDTEDGPIALTFAPIASSPLLFFEPFAWLPEVFLDRFIPPQNRT